MKLCLIDNYDSFSYLLRDYFLRFPQKKLVIDVKKNDITPENISLSEYDGFILSPGPYRPEKAGNLMKIVSHIIEKKPIFGVCLGLQAMVLHYGGELEYLSPMHGKSSSIYHNHSSLFNGLESPLEIGRYHSLGTRNLPDELKTTAHSSDDVIMALELDLLKKSKKAAPAWAVQFHPESILSKKNNTGQELINNVVRYLFTPQ